MPYQNIREEELKNKIASDYFGEFDTTKIVGNIDFCVTHITQPFTQSLLETEDQVESEQIQSLLWAEAKKGKSDILKSIVQLILTIGKARTFDKLLPPAFLGGFDAQNIAFVPYHNISGIFIQNDFNWNVTPSNHETKEFKLVLDTVKSTIESNSLMFAYATDDKEIREFIKTNFVTGNTELSKVSINKNNFLTIYNKWLTAVKPNIVAPWELAKKSGIIDADFYLADLLSDTNQTLKESLYVLLKDNHYEFDKKLDETGFFNLKSASFNDNQKAHQQFWNKYQRPPREEYWDYITERRDLLVPQDVRERKGSFFTPSVWVEKSQEYLMAVLGDNWQDDYYIWDCAAGTGNLLAGLTNKYNIYASTLDQADVDVMKDRIQNGTNLLASHCFKFDFLNDEFTKLPQGLQDIINSPEKRKKLVIYINPPYAEVSSVGLKGKAGVNKSKIHDKYTEQLGGAGRELFTQFLARIYFEINGCVIGEFSTLKVLQGSAFSLFRYFFQAKLEKCFIIPANTFDNVKGQFPIGFKIWNTAKEEKFEQITSSSYNSKNVFIGEKVFYVTKKSQFINRWISSSKASNNYIGFLAGTNGNDFQQSNIVYILNKKEQMANPRGIWINKNNLVKTSVYFSVRKCIRATWLNDRDQFLFPNDDWKTDREFQNNCLAYTLFHNQNNIKSKNGINNWIPFREVEVNAQEKFESHFMTDFMSGKLKTDDAEECLDGLKNQKINLTKLEFSPSAQAVFEAGRELYAYYHSQENINVNASLYEIKEYFQGRSNIGRMNGKSDDETYTDLTQKLQTNLDILERQIQPKVYKYGFLK